MKTLKTFFDHLGVHNREAFERLMNDVREDAEGRRLLDGLEIVDQSELEDLVARSGLARLELSHVIIKADKPFCPKVAAVDLHHCIVVGDLHFSGQAYETIELDDVCVFGHLSFKNIKAEHAGVRASSVMATIFELRGLSTGSINLSGCNIGFLKVMNCHCAAFVVLECAIFYLKAYDLEAEHVDFKHYQVFNISSKKNEAIEKLLLGDDILQMSTVGQHYDWMRLYMQKMNYETFDFLRTHSDIVFDKRRFAALKYEELKNSYPSFFGRLFVTVTGGFVKPVRIFVYGLALVLLFALGYQGLETAMPECLLASGKAVPNGFFDYVYFSAITFSTLGYGDIVPSCLGAKFLAMLEAFTGLTFVNFFTISFLRKYVEKD